VGHDDQVFVDDVVSGRAMDACDDCAAEQI
jgi:hypothetical protein